MSFSLKSAAFESGDRIPRQYTCDGGDVSPPLTWSGAPEETQSFALVCIDPDAPKGVFHHWAVYDIPPDYAALAEGCGNKEQVNGTHQAVTDFRKSVYGGPCPPHGHGPHHYHFRLSALRRPHLAMSPSPTCREVIEAAEFQAIETAELVGVYER